MNIASWITIAFVALPLAAFAEEKTPTTPSKPRATTPYELEKIDVALARGFTWMVSQQNPDGGFGPTELKGRTRGSSDVGLSAFCLYALARMPEPLKSAAVSVTGPAVKFLLGHQQADGSVHDPRDKSLLNYKTSVTLLALVTLDRVKYSDAIGKARDYLKSTQFSDKLDYLEERDLAYGGFGYLRRKPAAANLSVTQFTLEALHESGLSKTDSVWERVQVFLPRSQNTGSVDPLLKKKGIGTTDDGGFRYGPDITRGREYARAGVKLYSSYGSMTYSGLLSFLYAQVERDHPSVRAAFDWIQKNFTLEKNPGMATPENPGLAYQGLFFYYHTLSKALSIYGQPVLLDRHGQEHDWARELSAELLEIQTTEGYWVNARSERWMEAVPQLATSYAMVALSFARQELVSRVKK